MPTNPSSILGRDSADAQSAAAQNVRSVNKRIGAWNVHVQNHPASHEGRYGPTIVIDANVHTDGTLASFTMSLPFEVAVAVADALVELQVRLEPADFGAELAAANAPDYQAAGRVS